MAVPQPRLSSATGITLIEVLISMLVLIVGLVATAQLVAVSTVAQADAGAVTAATLDAQEKLEELVAARSAAPAIQISAADTLNVDVAGFFDRTAAGRTRRWHVEAGPVTGTRLVRVRVLTPRARGSGGVQLVSMVQRP